MKNLKRWKISNIQNDTKYLFENKFNIYIDLYWCTFFKFLHVIAIVTTLSSNSSFKRNPYWQHCHCTRCFCHFFAIIHALMAFERRVPASKWHFTANSDNIVSTGRQHGQTPIQIQSTKLSWRNIDSDAHA